MQGFAISLAALALAIVPPSSRDRARADRPIRAGGEGSLADVVPRGDDAAALAGRQRLAVLPFAVAGDDPALQDLGFGTLDALVHDLHYVPSYLVADPSEVLRALAGPNPPAADPADAARRLGARFVIAGTVTGSGGDLQIAARLIDVSGAQPKEVATAQAQRPRDQVDALTAAVLLDLLRQAGTLPAADRVDEISKPQTESFPARAACDAGFALLARSAEVPADHRAEADRLVEQALQQAEAAAAADPRYVRADLLRAGALMSRDNRPALEQCLTDARRKVRGADLLTRLEVEGDYYAFVRHDADQAASRYQQILEVDPAHSRALWALAALHAGELADPSPLGDQATRLAAAGRFAARLVRAHPSSAAAEVFRAARP